jgi:hypothetical protein
MGFRYDKVQIGEQLNDVFLLRSIEQRRYFKLKNSLSLALKIDGVRFPHGSPLLNVPKHGASGRI